MCKIAILGTRGIPNNYGGFEQFAEYLSVGLANKGFEVTVYNPHFHPYNEEKFKGVNIVRIYSPEYSLGGWANFIYDFLCLAHAYFKRFSIVYELGYGSSAISFALLHPLKHKNSILVTNMDGLEWKRQKWNLIIKWFTKKSEKMAINYSDCIISDNVGIQNYYRNEYQKDSIFFPYGAEVVTEFEDIHLTKYRLQKNKYYLIIARIEPENNIELMIQCYLESKVLYPLIVVGNTTHKYGRYIQGNYELPDKVIFLGGIYEKNVIDSLRHFSKYYLHGHSVGGTNPSLLEAMACSCLIVSHDNEFNRSVLGDDAFFFSTSSELVNHFTNQQYYTFRAKMIHSNLDKIKATYNWEKITHDHFVFFGNLNR